MISVPNGPFVARGGLLLSLPAPGYPGLVRQDPRFERLETPRLVLRRSRPEDAEAISRYRSDPDVHRYQGWETIGLEDTRRSIEEMLPHHPGEPDRWFQFSVDEAGSGRLVGDVGLNPAGDEPGVVKVGYTIAPEFQGRGYATEAMAGLIGYAFDTLGADTIRAYADARNVPSIRVAEKLGMRPVERIERAYGSDVWRGVRYETRRDA